VRERSKEEEKEKRDRESVGKREKEIGE